MKLFGQPRSASVARSTPTAKRSKQERPKNNIGTKQMATQKIT